MESRTTTFEAKSKDNFQSDLESESGYTFEEKVVSEGAISIFCYPKTSGVPVRIDYSTGGNPSQSEVRLYTVINLLASGGEGFVNTEDVFSYKSSVKMDSVHPWVAQLREKHGKLCGRNRIDEAVGRVCAGRSMKLIWEGMRKGLAVQHEKKSRAKDKKDKDSNELF